MGEGRGGEHTQGQRKFRSSEGFHSLAYNPLLSKNFYLNVIKGLKREEILSQMTESFVYVTLVFKSQSQKCGTSCNDLLNMLVTTMKTP